jgi:GT2 family glycosyltransferase
MSLISIAIFDTEDNRRSDLTNNTVYDLLETVDFNKHRLFLIDNASCKETKDILRHFALDFEHVFPVENLTIIHNETNVGTARAINQAWKQRNPGEHCIKMDNDVVIHSAGWVEQMEECVRKQPQIGIIGLKRKDLMEYPEHPDENFRSQLIMLPHERGEKWMIVEAVGHVMGTCQMYSSALLDKIGYLYQPGIYGFDDVLSSYRSHAAGFWNVFLPHIEIDHIDPGGTPYTDEKREYVKDYVHGVHVRGHEYVNGQRPVWEDA